MVIAKYLGYILILVILTFGYAKYIEKRSVYFPVRDIESDPAFIGLSFEDVFFQTEDNYTLHGWFVPCAGARYVILCFHGNAGNISHRLDKIKMFHAVNVHTFIIDYRGYGKSHGSPSESGLYRDAQAAYTYLVKQKGIPAGNILVYGASLGSAVAVDLASRVEVGGVIIDGGFSKARDLARILYPYLPAFLFSNLFDSLSKITHIDAPLLFFHSPNDEMIPYALARKLYDQAPGAKRFVQIRGDHNSAFFESADIYHGAIAAFVEVLNEKSIKRREDESFN